MFDSGTVYSLNYGESSWTEADCPIGGTVAPVQESDSGI
jgi:hypothetical protein